MNGPYVNYVTPNFFRVAGLDVRAGRGFTAWDRAGTQRVAVVDTALARLVWPGQNAVGRCLFVGREASDCTTVVGVAESALDFGLQDVDRLPHYYLPLDQAAADAETAENLARLRNLIVRTRGDPGRATAPVLTALAELFPDMPADRVQSLPAVLAPRIRPWRIGTGLFGAAALLAVLLAAFGLYAVVASACASASWSSASGAPSAPGWPTSCARCSCGRSRWSSPASRRARWGCSGPGGGWRRSSSTAAARAIRSRSPSRPRCW